MTTTIKNKQSILTKLLRAIYVDIIDTEDRVSNSNYRMTLLIPKHDKEMLDQIEQAVQAAIYKEWKDNVPGFIDGSLKDGDGKMYSGDSYPEYCKGHYLLKVTSRTAPDVVDMRKQPITDTEQLNFKSLYRVLIRAYAVSNEDRNAVYFGLNAVQKSDKTATIPRRPATDLFPTTE